MPTTEVPLLKLPFKSDDHQGVGADQDWDGLKEGERVAAELAERPETCNEGKIQVWWRHNVQTHLVFLTSGLVTLLVTSEGPVQWFSKNSEFETSIGPHKHLV